MIRGKWMGPIPGKPESTPLGGNDPTKQIIVVEGDNPPMPEMPLNVEVVANRIYFYNAINEDTILRLNKALRETSNKMITYAINNDISDSKIFLHLNSSGGGLFEGFAAADTILSSKIPVYTIVEGCAASAATILSMSGKRRFITKHAYMLIHQLSSAFWGKHEEMQDEMSNLNKLMDMIRTFYKERSKIPMKKLNEILKHDLYFDAQQCIEYGLVDEII